jgi:uncharacterized damage-inducible protein DinB
MYEHLNWANERILEGLQKIEKENVQVRTLFSHILLTEHVWFTRLQEMDSSQIPILAEVSLEKCTVLVRQNNENFTALLTNSSDTDLDRLITYRNSKGMGFKNSMRDILIHIALHAQYHRGQINQRLRLDGNEPVNTDYITFVR